MSLDNRVSMIDKSNLDDPKKNDPYAFQTLPEHVWAYRWEGWSTAQDIMSACPGVYIVPRGYDHDLRKTTEYDGSTAEVLASAPEFLCVPTAMDSDTPYSRANLRDWIVRKADGSFRVYSPEKFAQLFERRP